MSQFHKLKVNKIVRQTEDSVAIHLQVPAELKEEFSYKHGQYLTVEVVQNDVKHRRAYSLCSSPVADEYLAVGVKRVENGIVSTYLNDELKEGDTLSVFKPMGKFTIPLDRSNRKTYIMVGAGSGITPLYSILKTILAIEPMSKVYLLYGNSNQSSIMFKDDLEKLENTSNGRLKVISALSRPEGEWSGHKGRIDKGLLLAMLRDCGDINEQSAEFFVCGPTGMMEQTVSALKDRQVPEDHIHIEYFTAPIPLLDETEKKQAAAKAETVSDDEDETPTAGGDKGKVTVILNGEETVIDVEEGETILEAAMRQDLDPPYACQMGICTTCRAKLHAGKVQMDELEGLTDDEIEQGYILTCQSHPTTPGVKLEYQ